MPDIKTGKLTDLTPDPNNANRGTERGAEMVRRSLEKLGAGRSVLVDKHGVLLAGNKSCQAAVDIGLEDTIIVPTDGTKLVVVQRTDLDLATDAKAKELAIADNRASEVGLEWDTGVLEDLAQDVELADWFTEDEMAGWEEYTPPDGTPVNPEDLWEGMPEFDQPDASAQYSIKVNFYSIMDMEEFAKLVGQTITENTKWINYPYRSPDDLTRIKVIDES